MKKYGFSHRSSSTLSHIHRFRTRSQHLTLTPAQLKAKYEKNPQTFGDARDALLHVVVIQGLLPLQSQLRLGRRPAAGSIDADTTHGTAGFTAASSGVGLMDANFQKAAFEQPGTVRRGTAGRGNPDYAKTNLAGQCKPSFLINPISDARRYRCSLHAELETMGRGKATRPPRRSTSRSHEDLVLLDEVARPSTPTGYAPPAALTSPTTTSSTGSCNIGPMATLVASGARPLT